MNQLSIPFDEIIDIFEWIRRNRRSGLKKTGIFSDKELDFLVRITYDLTDKDFEYFIALILESDGFETSINGGWNDRGVDIIAKKDDTTFAIQCKQWSKARITLKDAGMYYASIYENMKKSHGRIFAYVTTSYIPEDVKEYFQMHGIYGIISNLKIIKESRKLGFFSEEGWKNMIIKIRERRIKDLQNSAQFRIGVGYTELKQELRIKRLQELKHHLPLAIRRKKSNISLHNTRHQQFYQHFFQYWEV